MLTQRPHNAMFYYNVISYKVLLSHNTILRHCCASFKIPANTAALSRRPLQVYSILWFWLRRIWCYCNVNDAARRCLLQPSHFICNKIYHAYYGVHSEQRQPRTLAELGLKQSGQMRTASCRVYSNYPLQPHDIAEGRVRLVC